MGARQRRRPRRVRQSGWVTGHPEWCWVCGGTRGKWFSAALSVGLSCPSPACLTGGSTVRPWPEQTGYDVGHRPALSGLSNHPLNTHRHPVVCRAAACLVACSSCSDSLHFGVCLDLLCCCCRRHIGGFGELSAELGLWNDPQGVPVSDRHRGLTWVGVDRRERGAAPCWQLCQRKPPWAERVVGWFLPPNEPLHWFADTLEWFSGVA